MAGPWGRLPRSLKHRVARGWYEALARFDRDGEIVFLNHGYAPLDGDDTVLSLRPEEERDRYSIQLYHRVAASVDWTGSDVLEVACGRGGGAAFLMRQMQPRSLLAIDLTGSAIAFCRECYRIPGLSFVQGDALALPVKDASVDIVITVEASNNFPGKPAFFREVARVLRPGGFFLLADYRRRDRVDRLRAQLSRSGLDCISEENFSPNIVRALELDDERKRRFVARRVPRFLRSTVSRFAFVRGGNDDEHSRFTRGDKAYLNFVLRKPEAPSPSTPIGQACVKSG